MKAQPQLTIAPEEARAISKEAYIYGFRLVDNDRIQYAYFVDKSDKEYKAPWNTIYDNARVYTPDDTAIQGPNSDTPYSYAGADLRAEPVVVSVPAMEQERFYHQNYLGPFGIFRPNRPAGRSSFKCRSLVTRQGQRHAAQRTSTELVRTSH